MGIILDRLSEFGDKPLMVYQGSGCRYSDLTLGIQNWLSRFSEMGINKGEVVSLIGRFSLDFTTLLFALLENKNIVVPLDDELRELASKRHEIAEVSHCFSYSEKDKRINYETYSVNQSHPYLERLRAGEKGGVILFTSGSSGECKAAVHDLDVLLKKYLNHKARKPLNALVFLKFDHIGGLSTLLSILMNGGYMVSIDDRSPAAICKIIEQEKVELLPTTPSFLNMLILSKEWKNYDLSSLKLITYGTEPMPDSTLRSLVKVFSSVKLKQTYGLTELGIFPTRSKSNDSTFMSIGEDHLQTKIEDDILYIKSDSAMLGYLNAESPFDKDGWYNTGDKVILEDGFTKILGRDSEMINVGGEKLYPAEVESVLLEIPNIKNVVVEGKSNPIMGQIVMAVVELETKEELSSLEQRVREFCKNKLESYKVPRHLLVAESGLISSRLKKIRQNIEGL